MTLVPETEISHPVTILCRNNSGFYFFPVYYLSFPRYPVKIDTIKKDIVLLLPSITLKKIRPLVTDSGKVQLVMSFT